MNFQRVVMVNVLPGNTVIKTIKALLFGTVFAYVVYLLASLLSFLVFEHGDFVTFFKSHYQSAYRIDEYGEKYFSPGHYQFVAHYVTPFGVVLVALIFLLIKKRQTVVRWMDGLMADVSLIKDIVTGAFDNLSRKEKLLLLTCFSALSIIKIYFFFTLPFHVDETFNFVYFVDQGILHSSVFANNHPLNNIISALWWKAGLPPEISLRLTSILSSLVIHLLIYSFITHYFNFRSGLFVLMFSGVTYWGNVYAVEGVAYMLMSLWALLGSIAVFTMYKVPGRGRLLFISICVSGFYTTQLFVIPFIELIVLWITIDWYNHVLKNSLPQIIFSVAVVVVASVLLYLPMYLWSGFEATFHSNLPRWDLIYTSSALFEGFSVMTDVNTKSSYVIAALLVPGIFYFRRLDDRLKCLLALVLSVIFSIVVFSLIIGVYPPSRAFVFTNILFIGTLGIFISSIVPGRLSTHLATGVLCAALLFKIALSVHIFNFGWQRNIFMGLQDKKSYEAVNDLSRRILAYKPEVIFLDRRDTYLNFYLSFLAIKTGEHVEFIYDLARLAEASLIIFNDENAVLDDHYEQVVTGDFGIVLKRKE